MSDWDFLYEMNEQGYSAEEIANAAACGVAPWEWKYIDSKRLDAAFEQAPDDSACSIAPAGLSQGSDGLQIEAQRQAGIFKDLVDCAARYFANTGRYLQIWGELGEIYAEIKFGLHRHEAHRAGSDGTIAGKLVEVKTISPEKVGNQVLVKSQGNFDQLLIVRIDRNFRFQGKLFGREELRGGTSKFLRGRFAVDTE